MQVRDEVPPQAAESLWHNRDYMWLWSGQVISTVGSAASTIIYPRFPFGRFSRQKSS